MRFRLAARARALVAAVLACGVVTVAGALAVAPREVEACNLLCPPTPSLPVTLPTLPLPTPTGATPTPTPICLPGTVLTGQVCLGATPTPPATPCVGPLCLPCVPPLCTTPGPSPSATPTPTTSTPTPVVTTPESSPSGGGTLGPGGAGGLTGGGRTAAGAGFGLRAGATGAVTKLDALSGLHFGNGLLLAPLFGALDALAVLVLLLVVRRSRRTAPTG